MCKFQAISLRKCLDLRLNNLCKWLFSCVGQISGVKNCPNYIFRIIIDFIIICHVIEASYQGHVSIASRCCKYDLKVLYVRIMNPFRDYM